MNIGFDAKRLFLNYTGLGNYSRFVVESLVTQFPENTYQLFTPKAKRNTDTDFFLNKQQVRILTPPRAMPLKSVWRTAGASFMKPVQELDIYHGLSAELPFFLPKKVKKVVTVHDLIFIRYPEYYSAANRVIYKAKLKAACAAADVVVAISHQTANDLFEFLNVPRDKVKIIYQGCHNQFRQRLSEESRSSVLLRHKLPEEYILNVGTIEPRKNLLTLIRALALIPESERIPLVVVGKATTYFDLVIQEVRKLKIENWVKFIHGLPFPDLPAVYQGARVFVYPSLFEGFGIPIVEAIESGVPVITSTGSCFSEAGGQYSIYVDPNSPEELAAQLRQLIGDDALRSAMVSKSKIFAEKFLPASIATDMMNCYRA